MIKKKYLRQVIISYVILALVQIIGAVWLNYNINNLATQQQEQQNMQNELYQTQNLFCIENIFAELESVQYSILASNYHDKNINSNGEYNKLYENDLSICLSSIFSEKRFEYFHIKDIFVYCENSNRIVSGINSADNLDSYIDTYYSSNFDNSKLISSKDGQEIFNVEYMGEKSIAVSLPYFGENGNSTSVIVIDGDFITDLCNVSNNDDVQFSIFNSEKQLVTSTLENVNFNNYSDESFTHNEFINDIEYSIWVYEDDNQGYFYVTYVPINSYYDQFAMLRDLTMIGTLTFIVVSVLLAFRIAYKTYSPVKEILAKIQGNVEFLPNLVSSGDEVIKIERSDTYIEKRHKKRAIKAAGVSEFDYINSTLEKVANEKAMLLDQINYQGAEAKYAHLIRLINGTIQNSDREYIKNSADIVSDNYVVILFRPEKYSLKTLAIESEDEIFKGFTIVYQNILEELSLKYGFGFFLPKRLNRFTLLLNLKDELATNYKKYVDELCDEFASVLRSYFEITNTVSVGNLETGIENIHNSYENAEYAMNYKFIYGRENTIHYKDLPEKLITSPVDNMVYRDLINAYITGASDDTACMVVEKIMEGIDEATISHMHINTFKYGCINALETTMRKFGEYENAYSLIYLLSTSETLDEFRTILVDILEQFRQQHVSTKEDDRLGNKIREYIDENYVDVNLCAISIAENFDVSKTYISRVFKTDYDKTISEYIMEVRVNEAKKLLQNSEHSVKTISELTGFLSSNTFIRSFKKLEGVTPGKYLSMKQ